MHDHHTFHAPRIRFDSSSDFSRDYQMFGLLVIVLLCSIFLLSVWKLALFLSIASVLLLNLESSFTAKIKSFLAHPDVSLDRSSFLLSSVPAAALAFASVWAYPRHFSWMELDGSQISLVATYSKSLIVSLALLSMFSFVKHVWVGVRMKSSIEVGVLALGNRAVVLIRTVLVTRFWVCHFANSAEATVFSPFAYSAPIVTKCYAIAKILYFARLIWEFDALRRECITGTERERGVVLSEGEVSVSSLFCCL
jgi:hypothetical protein